jgi:hypothetical protein
MTDLATIRAINAYSSVSAQIRARVENFIRAQWLGLGSYHDRDINNFVSKIVPVIEASQVQLGALTDAYIANIERSILGTSTGLAGIPAELVNDLAMRGVATSDVYQRSGVEVWTSLSKGDVLEKAANQGLARALTMAQTDMQLARTHSARHIFSTKDIAGYRRTLTGGKSCGLCGVASTQRYHKDSLMPIHPGCDCGIAPIYGKEDPGQVINSNVAINSVDVSERLGVEDFSGKQARTAGLRSSVVVHEHGEIGPVLTVKSQSFTGPSDIPA